MIIEIHSPELEDLIRERMANGGFQNVEDALMQALKSSPSSNQAADSGLKLERQNRQELP